MFNSIFGINPHQQFGHPQSAQNASGLQNAQQGQLGNAAMAQQQANAYSQALQQSQLFNQMQRAAGRTSPWVFNNKPCTLQQFAREIFPDDEQAQLIFVLKHEGS
jgi:hypothetical protein